LKSAPGASSARNRCLLATCPGRDLDSDLLYKFLLAEIAGQRGSYQVAAQA